MKELRIVTFSYQESIAEMVKFFEDKEPSFVESINGGIEGIRFIIEIRYV